MMIPDRPNHAHQNVRSNGTRGIPHNVARRPPSNKGYWRGCWAGLSARQFVEIGLRVGLCQYGLKRHACLIDLFAPIVVEVPWGNFHISRKIKRCLLNRRSKEIDQLSPIDFPFPKEPEF